MLAQVLKKAPHFEGMVWSNATQTFKKVTLNDYAGKNLLLAFYPLNFTFVCPTEINELDKLAETFKQENTEILVASVDSHHSHRAWSLTPRDIGGFGGNLGLDMLSDLSKSISREYGVLTDGGFSLRGTFLIGEDQKLKHMSINDPDVGRNMDEYLRLVQAYNYVKEHGDVCPSSWKKKGDAVMKGDMNAKSTSNYWKQFHKK